nr:PREDICTED: protein hu-li tai shao isoform X3 [Megachile rotundata]
MADTSPQPALSEPHTNGVMDGLTEEEKSKMRPADIDADMREMERRKRVEMMMNSRLFREELERIIETQMKDGAGPSGLLQQISDMMGAQGARFSGNVFKNSNCVLPINDIRGVESMGYAKGEKLLRCKLAAVFRLLDLYGWTQGAGGQITARLNQDQEHFLVNPYGLLYHEITASSLIKVDMQGSIVEQGTTNFGVHVAGFQLHSTIHAARPDIKCIVHITTPSVTAISSLKCGLLPIGQESIVIGDVSTHQYIGGSFEPEEKEKIARNLGPINKVMMLTNRGALCCGETVEEAFFNVYNMVLACETQLKLMPAGLDNLNLISEESKKAIFEASRKPPTPQQTTVPISDSAVLAEKLDKRWRIGGTEFEALMRMLDNAGFRTGYIYRNPLVKGEPPRPRNDVEVPPAVSSLGYLLEEEELYKQGLWKGGRKGTDRSRWLNSPNVYQKVEILETGTPDPKKITKWVSDGSPTHTSTPVKIDGALQFVPKNTNPKEFKQIQQQIKDYRRADKISAGPQSHILEGVTWEEAKKMQDATISGTGEQVVLVGAASKGIIQRGFQHNAMVYKTPYAKNPFDAVTDQELDQYKKEIERKQKGDIYDESQSESEALSSFNVSRATHESSTAKSPIQSPVSVTSETEEESRDEPRVLRIETKQVPAPSQPEVVLSDESNRYSCRRGIKYIRVVMAAPTITLNNGQKIPVLGLGTWQSGDDPSVVEQAVRDAVDAGYRHFDCAYIYGNEREIGKALREKIAEGVVKREDLFITTKLWNTSHKREHVVPACKRSVENFGLGYVDLYLVHWPVSYNENAKGLFPKDEKDNPKSEVVDYLDTWRSMEECVKLGLTKSIGLSNFNSQQIERVLSIATIKPVMNQVECHPNLNQKKLREFCAERGIAITAYSPFGSPKRIWAKPGDPQVTIDAPEIVTIGKKYGKTPAQVVLRYLIEIGTVPIPKSTSKERIKQNINIFDFNLSPEEIQTIDKLDRGIRICPASEFKDHKDYPFNIEF